MFGVLLLLILCEFLIFYINGRGFRLCMKLCFLCFQDPQVVTGSHDSTIKFWDLRFGNLGFFDLFNFLISMLIFLFLFIYFTMHLFMYKLLLCRKNNVNSHPP
jgi:WD40 repeat protein